MWCSGGTRLSESFGFGSIPNTSANLRASGRVAYGIRLESERGATRFLRGFESYGARQFKNVMTEQNLINEIFGTKWKNKYIIKWCDLCDCAVISCIEDNCRGSSCNGTGCSKCRDDFDEFNKSKTSVFEYLTLEERDTYIKCNQLKKHIMETLADGDKEIDWKKLDKEGKLSGYDCLIFLPEIYGKDGFIKS